MKTGKMNSDEYALAKSMWKEYDEVKLSGSEKEYVYEELDNNLTAEEKSNALVHRPIGNHYYTAINKGHNQYKIINKVPIEKPKNLVDEVLNELFGEGWEEM